MAGRFRARIDPATRQQRLSLRRDANGLSVIGIIERLDAIGIAGEEQAAVLFIPDGESEHAAQQLHHVWAVFGIESEKNRGVGPRRKCEAVGYQRIAQGAVIVNLVIIDNNQLTSSVLYPLGAAV